MGECLRKIPDHAPDPRIVFLGQQTDIVAQSKEMLEEFFCLLTPSKQDEVIRVPKAAGQESAFAALKPILPGVRVIAKHQTISHETAPDDLDRGTNTRIGRRQEAHQRDKQGAGIKLG